MRETSHIFDLVLSTFAVHNKDLILKQTSIQNSLYCSQKDQFIDNLFTALGKVSYVFVFIRIFSSFDLMRNNRNVDATNTAKV